jgi:hypothetical protein
MKTAGIFEEVGTISSHLSMKLHNIQEAYAEVRVVHAVLTDTSIAATEHA